MKCKRISALLLALIMTFALTACRTADNPDVSESVTPSAPTTTQPVASEEPSAEVTTTPTVERTQVNLAVLSGPTGIGTAKLLADSDADLTVNDYNYTIAADNNELVAGLTNGDIDIATVASNVAVNLYNKTDRQVQIIALGTLGVLHILESNNGTSVNSMEDLRGKTIYSAGQGANPEYILRYLLTQNGIDPDNDVTLVFADAAEITQKLVTGEAEVAMLPVPAATAAIIKGEGKIRAAIDVTEAWDSLNSGSTLVMTAVVARADFIAENKEAVDAFLAEYAASIDYVNNNVVEASQIIADLGITASSAIAKDAIPQCHLTYIAGKDMSFAISDYFMVLFELDPTSIGGYVPDDGIYYVP